jgi:hypothetical protein
METAVETLHPFRGIDTTKTLDQIYLDLCVQQREMLKTKESGLWTCWHCGREENKHDPRCNNFATSANFASHNAEWLQNVKKALDLIDELKSL